ncbi:MAG: hypothetical protein LBF24_01080 [Puniceicoccales bacterium]|jgi:hypothetical protein|nr:hypothetical protein [Puniceicoccales bacterium]
MGNTGDLGKTAILVFSSYIANLLTEIAETGVTDPAVLHKVKVRSDEIRGSFVKRFFRFALFLLSGGIAPLIIWICWHTSARGRSRSFVIAALSQCGVSIGHRTPPGSAAPKKTTPESSKTSGKGSAATPPSAEFRSPQGKCAAYLESLKSDTATIWLSNSIRAPEDAVIGVREFRGLPAYEAHDGENAPPLQGTFSTTQAWVADYVERFLLGQLNGSTSNFGMPAYFWKAIFNEKFINHFLQSSYSLTNWHLVRHAEKIFLCELAKFVSSGGVSALPDTAHDAGEITQSDFRSGMVFLADRVQHARPTFVEAVMNIFPEFQNMVRSSGLEINESANQSLSIDEALKRQTALLLCSESSGDPTDTDTYYEGETYRQVVNRLSNGSGRVSLDTVADWGRVANRFPDNVLAFLELEYPPFLQARTIEQAEFMLQLWCALEPEMQLQILSRRTFVQNVLLGRWLDVEDNDPDEMKKFCAKALLTVCEVAIGDRVDNPVARADLFDEERSGLLEMAICLCQWAHEKGIGDVFISSDRDGCRQLAKYTRGVSLPNDCELTVVVNPGSRMGAVNNSDGMRFDLLPKRRVVVECEPQEGESLFLCGSGEPRLLNWRHKVPLRPVVDHDGQPTPNVWYFETDYAGDIEYKIMRVNMTTGAEVWENSYDNRKLPDWDKDNPRSSVQRIAPTFF